MEYIDCEMFLAIKLRTFEKTFVCVCCQLAVAQEDQTDKLEQLVDFLVKIDEYDRLIDGMQLVSKREQQNQERSTSCECTAKRLLLRHSAGKKKKNQQKGQWLSKCLEKKQE